MTTQENTTQETEKKIMRHRSPNYPNYDLKMCVEMVFKFVKSNKGFMKAHIDYTKEHLGYTRKSTKAERAISAMLGFGLLNSEGSGDERYYYPTELAKKIYMAEEDTLKLSAIREAALNDVETLAVWNHWGKDIPGKGTLAKWLQATRNFSQEGANRFAYVITETYEFAKLKESVTLDEQEELEETPSGDQIPEEKEMPDQNGSQEKQKLPPPPVGYTDYPIPVDGGRHAVLRAPSGLTDEDFEFIVDYIELLRRKLAKKEKKL